ncbi:MAG: hypothetical protein EAZ92_00650 [Candidatus Kapaibacterium sp.]|nr:MAG: hypothetical protein EAZ92_00650 [Candidatus Kapabacteria bacterium]
MARSIDFHFQTIVAAVAADPVLSTRLTSTSKVAIWRLFAYVVATVAFGYETIVDQGKAFIELLVNNRATGTEGWLVAETYKFQYGDTLELINGVITYADTISEAAIAKQIIKRASFSEDEPSEYFLKVAKEDANGNPIPLTTLELQALIAYWQKKKYPGVNFETISKYPDKLKVNITIYRNPQVLDSVLTPQIETAIKNYLKAIPFNGEFLTNRFTDYIQEVPNVEDIAVIGQLQVRYNNGPGENDYTAFQPIGRKWKTKSGHMKLDEFTVNYLSPDAP